jgi:HTH-type transcriptional regulator/antitoxin HigA
MDDHRNAPFTPDYAVHPGMLLEQELEHRELSQTDFARRIGRTPKLVSEIISGKNPVEPETAIQFEKVLGIGADIWLRLEAQFRLHEARQAENERLAASEQWFREFPVKQLSDWGIIRKTGTTAQRAHDLLALFGVASPAAFDRRYAKVVVHYRTSPRMEASRTSLLTWLRCGEVSASERELPSYDKVHFKKQLVEIRKLTTENIQVFRPKITELCRNAGVAFILIPPLPKTRLSGAAFWAQGKVPVIQQSLRHKTNDHFWFTFFHEAAHIILHNPKDFYADDENGKGDGVEQEANEFATEILVGKKELTHFIAKNPASISAVRQFAKDRAVHPGIVVGMLQHHGVISWDQMNHMKDKYEWVPNDNRS